MSEIEQTSKTEDESVVNATQAVFHQSMYSGPIPPPEMLAAYKEIYPESVPMIFDIFQQQAESRIRSETIATEAQISLAIRGQIFGFILSVIALFGSFVLIGMGESVVGIVSLLGTAITLIGLFVYDRYQSQQNEKQEESPEENNPDLIVPPSTRNQ